MASISFLYLFSEKCFKPELVFVHLSCVDTLVGSQAHGLKICPLYPFIMCEAYSFIFFSLFPSKKLQPTCPLSLGSLPGITHARPLSDTSRPAPSYQCVLVVVDSCWLHIGLTSLLSEFKGLESLFSGSPPQGICNEVCWCPDRTFWDMLTLISRIVTQYWGHGCSSHSTYPLWWAFAVTYKVDPPYFSILEMTELLRDWDGCFSRTLHRAELRTEVPPLSTKITVTKNFFVKPGNPVLLSGSPTCKFCDMNKIINFSVLQFPYL